MKKSILAIAVAATMAAPAAMAAPTVYGNVHLSIVDLDSADNIFMNSNTSSLGVKGSEDLGDGLKAIYKVEFQVDAADGVKGSKTTDFTTLADGDVSVTDSSTIGQRDIFVGLKGGMGTVKLGLMSSNYKQMGGKVDSLYRPPAEGRGLIHTQSGLHGGSGKITTGRQSNTLQYSSPKMGGAQLVANTTFSGADEETTGVGVRWSNKSILVYADWISMDDGSGTANTEAATKAGVKFSNKAFFIGGQFETAEDLKAYNYIHVNGGWIINSNNIITATVGTASHITDDAMDTTGLALAYDHKLSKMTDVYVAYLDKSSDTAAIEDSALALGIRKKF